MHTVFNLCHNVTNIIGVVDAANGVSLCIISLLFLLESVYVTTTSSRRFTSVSLSKFVPSPRTTDKGVRAFPYNKPEMYAVLARSGCLAYCRSQSGKEQERKHWQGSSPPPALAALGKRLNSCWWLHL